MCTIPAAVLYSFLILVTSSLLICIFPSPFSLRRLIAFGLICQNYILASMLLSLFVTCQNYILASMLLSLFVCMFVTCQNFTEIWQVCSFNGLSVCLSVCLFVCLFVCHAIQFAVFDQLTRNLVHIWNLVHHRGVYFL